MSREVCRLVDLRYGVIAATVTLAKGADKSIDDWLSDIRGDREAILLFGSSDLLVITSNVSQFDGSGKETTGRTANTYLAACLDELGDGGRPRMFRALSFLRAQRPDYERFTAETLESLRAQFKAICDENDVACRILLGYGWADLYLDLSSENIRKLFRAIVGCRAVMLRDTPAPGVFHNAFTIVGVAWSRQNEVAQLDELVRPKISLRVEPTELTRLMKDDLLQYFPSGVWNMSVTSGKRDIFIIPKEPVRFGDFWTAHRAIRHRIGQTRSPIHKMETHFDFDDDILPPSQSSTPASPCACFDDGAKLAGKFRNAADACKTMGPGLKKSFDGLANLYDEALDARDSCCDFDAAAAHYFSQRALFRQYQKLCELAKSEIESESPAAQTARRRRRLLHDVIDRLEVSSVFIFNQEQNGSYSDLLSRSERVSLYRGGMQKINVALLIAIDNLIRRQDLSIWPMLCWWPAGQIQSERPIGVIKVPVYFLHRPEVAFFLIIHELGQLTAFDYFRKQPPPPPEDETLGDTPQDRKFARENFRIRLSTSGLQRMLIERGETPDIEYAENRGVDSGKLITDLWADVYLLRMGFRNDLIAWREFLFEQFLDLVRGEHGLFPLTTRSAQFVARLIALTAAAIKVDEKNSGKEWSAITAGDLVAARYKTIEYLKKARLEPRYQTWTEIGEDLHVILRDPKVINKAEFLALDHSDWVDQALQHVDSFTPDDEASPENIEKIEKGTLTEIKPSEITSYFRALLNAHEPPTDAPDDEKRPLFLARAALISSILAYCPRTPRLPIENSRP